MKRLAYYTIPIWMVVVVFAMECAFNGVDLSAEEVRFGWRTNSDPVAGYRLYHGPGSRHYTNFVVIPHTQDRFTMQALAPQYFALTAFNSAGLESDYTPEQSIFNVVSERSCDGVLWESGHTNVAANLWPVEFWRLRIER